MGARWGLGPSLPDCPGQGPSGPCLWQLFRCLKGGASRSLYSRLPGPSGQRFRLERPPVLEVSSAKQGSELELG